MKLTSLIKNQLWEFKDRKGRVNFAIERTSRNGIVVLANDSTKRGREAFIEADEFETVTEAKAYILVIANRRRKQVAKEKRLALVTEFLRLRPRTVD